MSRLHHNSSRSILLTAERSATPAKNPQHFIASDYATFSDLIRSFYNQFSLLIPAIPQRLPLQPDKKITSALDQLKELADHAQHSPEKQIPLRELSQRIGNALSRLDKAITNVPLEVIPQGDQRLIREMIREARNAKAAFIQNAPPS